jgi:glycosyltransferase involved in cell wall biosynthesis
LRLHEPALQYLRRYVKVSQWRDEKYLALMQIADIELREARYAEAIAAAREALDVIPEWPNACFSLAETYYYLKDWPAVVEWCENGRARPFPDTVCILNPCALRFSWIIHYTNALYYVGRVSDAIEWSKKALEICPGDSWHTINLRFFLESSKAKQQNAEVHAASLSRLPQIVWTGPLLDASGYAEEGREFVMGLDAIGVHVRASPLEWCSRRVDLTARESAVMERLIHKEEQGHPIRVFHVQPVHWQLRDGSRHHIGRTMCETDRIPESWVAPCNSVDEIWVPCQHNVETFAYSGVDRRKLRRIPEGINVERYQRCVTRLSVRGARRFNFLSVFEWSRHKGWDLLVRAFATEFRSYEGIALILKTGAAGGQSIGKIRQAIAAELRIAGLGAWLPPHIVVLAGKLPSANMPALYRAADAFVLPSRGEGWCRPLMEAMLMGLPTIGTRWSGPLEFMNDDNSYLVDCSVVDVPPEGWREIPIFRGHRWAEPSVRHLREQMRRVVSERGEAQRKAEVGRQHIIENFSRERVARLVKNRLHEIVEGAHGSTEP